LTFPILLIILQVNRFYVPDDHVCKGLIKIIKRLCNAGKGFKFFDGFQAQIPVGQFLKCHVGFRQHIEDSIFPFLNSTLTVRISGFFNRLSYGLKPLHIDRERFNGTCRRIYDELGVIGQKSISVSKNYTIDSLHVNNWELLVESDWPPI